MSKGRVRKFSFDDNVIAYRIWRGPAVLVAFHGFGQLVGFSRRWNAPWQVS